MSAASLSIVIPLYNGVTHLDFTGPHQFLSRLPNATVTVASVGGKTVEADGLCFSNLAKLEDIEKCDVLCVPGGGGCTSTFEDSVFIDSIRKLGRSARYLTSVCTGSLILGAAGLLVGRRAACHWAWRDLLGAFGAIPDAGRVVRDGNIITGGGVTAGIDFALTVIAEVAGEKQAKLLQLGLEYAPQPPFESGTPEQADAETLATYRASMATEAPRRRHAVERAAARLAEPGASSASEASRPPAR